MRLIMIGLILLALLAAGGTAVLVKRYLDSQAEQQARMIGTKEEAPAIYVIVADENLPAGTTLTSGALRWQKWPEDAIESVFLSSDKKDSAVEKKLVGAVIRRSVVAGTPVTEGMVFRRGTAGFLAGMLDEGMRAMAVAVDATSGASGFILPGDRVDVILTFDVREVTRGLGTQTAKDSEGGEEGAPADIRPAKFTSETVLKGLRVVAIDQDFKAAEGESKVAKTVTLEVTPAQSEVLAVARAMGRLSLALRSHGPDVAEKPSETFTGDTDISPTLRNYIGKLTEAEKRKRDDAEARRAAQAARDRRSPAPDSGGARVRIYRGGQETTQEFPAR